MVSLNPTPIEINDNTNHRLQVELRLTAAIADLPDHGNALQTSHICEGCPSSVRDHPDRMASVPAGVRR